MGASGESKTEEGLSTPTPQGKSLEGVRTLGWATIAVCAQKQGWGQCGEEGR